MFYEEKEITESLKCPFCQDKFDDPRILECGESMCNNCILLNMNGDSNGFKCIICNQFHEMPKNGFIKIKRLSTLVKIKPSEVSRSPIASLFKTQLNKIHDILKTIEYDLKMGKEKIKEYCDFIRNDVVLVTESWHQYIEKYHDELVRKINDYENECLKEYTEFELSQKSSELEGLIKETDLFFCKWSDYLRKFVIDESELTKASEEASIRIDCLEMKIKYLKNKTFNGKLLEFEENHKEMKTNKIGQIKFRNIRLYYEQLNNIQTLSLIEKLSGLFRDNLICIETGHNESFVIVYRDSERNNLNILTMNKDGNILNRRNDLIAKKQPDSNIFIYNLKLVKIDNFFTVFSYYIDDKEYERKYTLKIYDQNLDLTTEKSFDFNIDALAAYEKNLYSLSTQNDVNTLSIYDLNLLNLNNFGQSNRYLPYYFPSDIKKLEVNESFYFFLDQNDIYLMNNSDGVIFKQFKINSNDFSLYLNKYVLSFDSASQRLTLYNMEGSVFNEDKLEKMTAACQLKKVSNESLIFYDANDMSIYF